MTLKDHFNQVTKCAELSVTSTDIITSQKVSDAETFGTTVCDPVAIVGIGCRFPGGADSPVAFWQLLSSGRDAICDVPESRWSIDRFYSPDTDQPGKTYVRKGGFLKEAVDEFDAAFFGISPREAIYMDPQQRFLLEVAWEAMEDAGIPSTQLAGTDTGVYIGGFTLDSLLMLMSPLNRETLGTHSATSASMTMLSNRLSYCFDLRGPSVSVDTACSSSLVAVHLACQGIWRGDCSKAIAGGVNIMLRPEYPIIMSKGHFLAPDGYCKSFDERANGYSRGEGAGVVLLKPLSEALRDRDHIYAYIRGTGVNQDGRTDGITVPNADAQEALIQRVYARSQVPLDAVRYVEAHGTGTPVGDPIEASVLGRTVGAGRGNGNACIIGSAKASIGHLEAAAGVAGLIKAALCLQNNAIPPQANLQKPNPKIPFEELGIRLPRGLEPLRNGGEPVYVGVNSFGYGGTNAHVVLQNAAAQNKHESVEPACGAQQIMALSARNPKALTVLARSFADLLSSADVPALRNLCYSANVRRAHHEHRLAVVGNSADQMASELANFVEHGLSERVFTGKVAGRSQRQPVFVFTGMGPQWWGMGRELLDSEPVFRRTAESVDEIFRSMAGWSILAEMLTEQSRSRMHETQIAQPSNFLLQVALADLLCSWGVSPAAIVGHSVGEVSAAYVAGALDLEDAVRVSYHRSRLQQRAAGKGRMLATGLTIPQAKSLLAECAHLVSIAAINSPSAVTLAGDPETLASLGAQLTETGVFNRFLQVEVAYHSPNMDPLKAELREVLRDIRPKPRAVAIYSTVTGRPVDGSVFDAEYWCDNIREPVLFADAVDRIIADGHSVFLEIGPHPVLSTSIKDAFRQNGDAPGLTLGTLRRDKPERPTILGALGGLYAHGYDIDWKAIAGEGCCYVKLPTYPWQRECYWNETAAAATDRIGRPDHPLLGLKVPAPAATWDGELNRPSITYLKDHVIDGVTVFPGAGYVEQGLALQRLIEGSESGILEDIEFHRPLVLPADKNSLVRTTFDEASREYRVYARREDEPSACWTLHASGRLLAAIPFPVQPVPLQAIKLRCHDSLEADRLYDRLARHGLQYGPSFQRIRRLWRRTGEVLAELEAFADSDDAATSYHLHPTVLDASIQALIAGDDDGTNAATYLPVSILRVTYRSRLKGRCWSHGRVTAHSEHSLQGDIVLCDDEGTVIAEVLGLRCRALAAPKNELEDRLLGLSYVIAWEKAERNPSSAPAGSWLVLADAGGFGADLARRLRERKVAEVVLATLGEIYGGSESASSGANGEGWEYLERILAEAADCEAIVYLLGLDWPETAADPTAGFAGIAFLQLVQALATRGGQRAVPRLYVVTRGAQPVGAVQPPALDQAILVGLARTAASEYPNLRCTLIDIEPAEGDRALAELIEELSGNTLENDLALRESGRYVYRLTPEAKLERDPAAAEEPRLSARKAEAFRLGFQTVGRLESLCFNEMRRRAPGPGEVELCLKAAALNFKDVLKVLGMLPEKALESTYHGTSLGMEAAGVISAVGEAVEGYRVGDAVVASVPDSFSSHITMPANRLLGLRKIEAMSFEDAASLPVIFMTAYYALHELARLQKNETVLIHAAAGGVGLAAIQVAQWLGARIIATAGSEEKRAYIRSLGVDQVLNSRTLEFADQVMALTSGRGTDVVLNSIAGEIFLKSLAITAPMGRFIEIGKRDIVESARMPMLPFNRGLSFTAIDLDRIMAERPELIQRLLGEVWERFLNGDFKPTPVHVFPAAKVTEAFRYMMQSKQIGKIVLSFNDFENVPVVPLQEERKLFAPDVTYLITGGLGGFGLKVARWMAQEGARNLVLVGRTGARTPEAQQTVRELQDQDITVLAMAGDISQEHDVISILERIAGTMPPLRGILHAAAVLDDALLINLDADRLERVMAPKARGAWFLHKHTRGLPLDYFVLFSSVSALIGNPGQGNYVAANVFLDILAHHRRALGLPASSLNWGALGEVGMLARDSDVADHLVQVGIKPIVPADALAALRMALRRDVTQLGFMDMDWAKWGRVHPAAAASPSFTHVLGEQTAAESSAADRVRAALHDVDPKERPALLAQTIAELVAETMRLPPDRIDINEPLSEMGIDSLMAVDLQIAIKLKSGIEFPVLELVKGGSILALGRELLARMNIPLC